MLPLEILSIIFCASTIQADSKPPVIGKALSSAVNGPVKFSKIPVWFQVFTF